jgi:hypothetical protein
VAYFIRVRIEISNKKTVGIFQKIPGRSTSNPADQKGPRKSGVANKEPKRSIDF